MKRVWIVALLYWLAFGLLCTLLYPVTLADPITRYAPMANYFAAGNFELAFHPRFGVLFQVLTGALTFCTGIDGARSAQIIAVGFVALAGVPLWHIVKKQFDAITAWFAVALLYVAYDFARYSMDGLRDNGKCLAFVLIGYGILEKRSLWFALGLFIMMTLATYCFAVGSLFAFGWCLYWIIKRDYAKLPLTIGSWILATVSVTYMVHHYTGYWLPVPNYVKLLGLIS